LLKINRLNQRLLDQSRMRKEQALEAAIQSKRVVATNYNLTKQWAYL